MNPLVLYGTWRCLLQLFSPVEDSGVETEILNRDVQSTLARFVKVEQTEVPPLSVAGAGVPHVNTVRGHLGLDCDVSSLGVDRPVEPGDVGGIHQPDGRLCSLLHCPRQLEGFVSLDPLLGLEDLVYVSVDAWQELCSKVLSPLSMKMFQRED